jgi:hypothetical protein
LVCSGFSHAEIVTPRPPILKKETFDTVLGKISFDAKGDVKAPGYVVYAWNTGTPGNMVNERFSLTTDAAGQDIRGSVSLLGKSYVVLDGKRDGNSVMFTTRGRESRGTGEPPLDVTYQYRATVAGDTMSVTIFAEGVISKYSPVIKFMARRVPVAKQE